MEGITKFKIHMHKTVLNTGISEIPANENSQTAAPPFTTTSKIKMVGIIEAIRYMEKINGMNCNIEMWTLKKCNRL